MHSVRTLPCSHDRGDTAWHHTAPARTGAGARSYVLGEELGGSDDGAFVGGLVSEVDALLGTQRPALSAPNCEALLQVRGRSSIGRCSFVIFAPSLPLPRRPSC